MMTNDFNEAVTMLQELSAMWDVDFDEIFTDATADEMRSLMGLKDDQVEGECIDVEDYFGELLDRIGVR